jgi:thiosulfate dehydrogenase (quinone) large subunit
VHKRALRYHVPPVPQLAITDRNDRAIAALRIAVGLLFLIFAEYKLFGAKFTRGGGFEYWINRFLADGAYPFMKPLLRGLVLPHARFFAWLVAFGEGAIGLSLTSGVWTRIASIFGLLYMLSLLFSANYPGPDAAFWMYFGASLEHSVLAICFAAFIVGDPQQRWSIRTVRAAVPRQR